MTRLDEDKEENVKVNERLVRIEGRKCRYSMPVTCFDSPLQSLHAVFTSSTDSGVIMEKDILINGLG